MKKSSSLKNLPIRLEGGAELAVTQLGMQEETAPLKTMCAVRLNNYLDTLGWTQLRIGRELGLSQPHVSELRNYALTRFSADRLLQFMASLGLNVSIRIETPKNGNSTDRNVQSTTIAVPPVHKTEKKAA